MSRAWLRWLRNLLLIHPRLEITGFPVTLSAPSAAGQGSLRVPQGEPQGAGGPGARGPRPGEPGRVHRQTEEDPGGEGAGSAGGRQGERGMKRGELPEHWSPDGVFMASYWGVPRFFNLTRRD